MRGSGICIKATAFQHLVLIPEQSVASIPPRMLSVQAGSGKGIVSGQSEWSVMRLMGDEWKVKGGLQRERGV